MDEIFCPLTKGEVMRIIDHLEAMYYLFWSKSPQYSAKELQDFIGHKNFINSILLKATERKETP